MKILIIANRVDDHTRVVFDALKKKGVIPIIWPTNEFLYNQKSSLYLDNSEPKSAKVYIDHEEINFDEIEVVWFRRPSYPYTPQKVSSQDRKFIFDENKISMRTLWFELEKNATWVNPFSSGQKANTKIFQLENAAMIGMKIPITLVTNDRKEIINFINKNGNEGTIYKTFLPGCWTEGDKRYNCQTTAITVNKIPKQSTIRLTPGIYQRRVPKAFEIRATFFGDHYIAIQIHNTLELDWRLSFGFKVTSIKLPVSLERQCLLLMKKLNIVFGCFDFIVTPAGDYYFLEVNEMGQFLWIEEMLPELKFLDTFCNFLIFCSHSIKTTFPSIELDTISNSKSYLNALINDAEHQEKIACYLEVDQPG